MKALAADDPRVIGEYRLRAQLGAGGMGRVYLGLSPAGRAVAIKVVHPDLASDSEFLRRFGQEVAAARAVSGIYTAPVVASGLNERPPWLATAFVPGPPLDQVITEHGPLPEQALWPLLAGLVEALQAIHACGVVHRDLKPANVLLATDGPRVIDFGISRAADGTALTAAGVVFGTPGYMAPEQAEGQGAWPASDVFALGCVVAYAAAGTGPFGTGTAAAVLYRVVHTEPVLDRIPPPLRKVITACLAKDPAARPALPALSAAISRGMDATGPSAVAFWPSSVAGLIGAYQARLERETRSSRSAGAEGFSWATAVHPPTTPSDPGNRNRPQPEPPRPEPALPEPALSEPALSEPALPEPARPEPALPEPALPQPPPPGPSGGPGAGPRWPYPAPRGYLPANGGPHGNGGPSAGSGPSAGAGHRPAGRPMGYPQPYQVGSRGPVTPPPASMVAAVRLMYAGAFYTLVWALGIITVSAMIIRDHPVSTPTGYSRLAGVVTLAIFTCVVEIALWLWIARACKRGRNWARVTGTVLFGLDTLGVLGVLASPQAGLGPAKVLTLIGWLIGCGAVVFLWQRPSSAFFNARTSLNR